MAHFSFISSRYLAALVGHNEKRAQLRSEEAMLAGDGFMLNLLAVLQALSDKIDLFKVDLMYAFHPKKSEHLSLQNDTRLKMSSQEVQLPFHCPFYVFHQKSKSNNDSVSWEKKILSKCMNSDE